MSKTMENFEEQIRLVLKEREESALVWLCDATRDAFQAEGVHSEKCYDALYERMEGMPLEQVEAIQNLVTLISREEEQEGFRRGFLLGMKLCAEIDKIS